ncbi:response regulator [Parapedobacter tibetensis]|uniref:response regulator n=1 Tax=Parapedobacter tibetensis TaxID=2972951 RepID=UPI00214D2E77|nr:response regulator [Parapedobacter tibetensis]
MNKLKLVIVDDKEENVLSLKALLADVDNLNIWGSTSPNEALRYCWNQDVAIALVDVQMPEINGFEFVSLLQSNPKTWQIMVIMVTAISKEDKFLLKGLHSGAIDYLYKPLNPDITVAKVKSFMQQVYIQRELKRKNEELERSHIELIKAKKEADLARKSKENFLANMSHEIRTPINGITGITTMLRNSPLNGEQSEWLDYLENASQSLLLIINDILDLSKIDSGKMRLDYAKTSLPNIIKELGNLFTYKAEQKGITFKVAHDENLPKHILADSLRLTQILSNLISNGIKFTEKGSVCLETKLIKRSKQRVHIQFSVKDTGIGISSNALDKIFQSFEQGEEGITKRFGGTGLGLAIVKRLVNLHQGQIHAHSELGKGSEFIFQCWFDEEASEMMPKSDRKQYTDLPLLNDVRVLLAEDNDLNSFMVTHMLNTWGITVDTVKNGREALEKVENTAYNLILMDAHMPVMSGFDAIRAIRNDHREYLRQIPIISISASVLQREQQAAYAAGANAVVGKPFDPVTLYQIIKTLTHGKSKAEK